ncbi:MAG: hypothetical protein JG782_302 [Anaerophaga sp.]|nr:hypothetical protein [Anaerophaga sp.]
MKTFLVSLMVFLGCSLISATGNETMKEPESPVSGSAEDTTKYFRFFSFTDKSEWESIPVSKAGKHYLGEDIARKFYLFKNLYTYQTPVSPGSPAMRTVIRKPVVYNALNKLEKHLKKINYEGNAQNAGQLGQTFEHALDVAIAIYSQETPGFESELENSDSATEIMNVFSRVELIYP